MKITTAKKKVAAKAAKAKKKVARKCKGRLAVIAAALCLATLVTGCATSDSTQPARANIMENKFEDCIIVVAPKTSVSNRVVVAEGTTDMPAIELFTQALGLENNGTETTTQTTTQTPTTDVKPDIDVHYNDAVKNMTDASKDVLGQLTDEGAQAVLKMITGKLTGTVEVEKKDGTKTTVDCKDGQCSFGGGCTTGACGPGGACSEPVTK